MSRCYALFKDRKIVFTIEILLHKYENEKGLVESDRIAELNLTSKRTFICMKIEDRLMHGEI